ncbi:MAG TPA: ribonuclease J [Patescibacteria group bacterium]|nr:ribonuclease J [Patescibacteria group bacterium]
MKKTIKIIPLGGLEEVGKNCIAIEYSNDIIVVDLGVGFPSFELPGVKWLLPSIDYLEKNKKKIKALLITHGHLDHIGGVPYLWERLGKPPIYATDLTIALLRERLKDENVFGAKFFKISPKQKFRLGSNFAITPFNVVHNIPESVGFVIKTPIGTLVHTGDWKFDDDPTDQPVVDKSFLKKVGNEKVLALMSDSTNAIVPGRTLPEKKVGETIEKIIVNAKARVIFTSFSTLVSRIHQVLDICKKNNRKVAIAGFSIVKMVRLVKELNYFDIPDDLIIDLKSIHSYPDKNILIIASGTQGEPNSTMTRVANREHSDIKVKPDDTIVFSSSAIPGNELSIHKVMDRLIDQGAEIIYKPVLGAGVHSSGHACKEGLREMLDLIRPKFFIPIEGGNRMQVEHIKLAKESGVKEKNCFLLNNGDTIEMSQNKVTFLDKKKLTPLIVSGGKVKKLKRNIIKERRELAESGICILSQQESKNVEVLFLGLFVEDRIIKAASKKAKRLMKKYGTNKKGREQIKKRFGDFLLSKLGKKPIVVVF